MAAAALDRTNLIALKGFRLLSALLLFLISGCVVTLRPLGPDDESGDESTATSGAGAPSRTRTAPRTRRSPDAIYDERLVHVTDGHLPSNWVGGQNLMVRTVDGRRAVVFFQGDRDTITIPDLAIPTNWRLRLRVSLPDHAPEMIVVIGDIRCRVSGGPFDGQNGVRLNDTVGLTDDLRGTEVIVDVERRDDVVTAAVNGRVGPVIRVPPMSAPSSFLQITFGAWNEAAATAAGWRIYEVVLDRL